MFHICLKGYRGASLSALNQSILSYINNWKVLFLVKLNQVENMFNDISGLGPTHRKY